MILHLRFCFVGHLRVRIYSFYYSSFLTGPLSLPISFFAISPFISWDPCLCRAVYLYQSNTHSFHLSFSLEFCFSFVPFSSWNYLSLFLSFQIRLTSYVSLFSLLFFNTIFSTFRHHSILSFLFIHSLLPVSLFLSSIFLLSNTVSLILISAFSDSWFGENPSWIICYPV